MVFDKCVLLVMRGQAGAGKTTLAESYAREYDCALLSQDIFIFDFNPSAGTTRHVSPDDEEIGFKNLISVLSNYMNMKKPIVLEGALATLSEDGPYSCEEIMDLAQCHGFKSILITLVADEEIRRQRQMKRGYVLPLELDRRLATLVDTFQTGEASFVIDTSILSEAEALERIKEVMDSCV